MTSAPRCASSVRRDSTNARFSSSSEAVGSSAKMIEDFRYIDRAIATLRCSPPLSTRAVS